MIHQVFPVTRAFNRQTRDRCRAEPHRPVTQSPLEVDMRSAHTDGGRQHRDGLLSSSPQIRANKIAQLGQAVESGNYRVSAEQIAEKMMQEALIAMLA